MKKYYILIILLAIVLISSPVFTKDEPETQGNVILAPGMELKQVGTVNRLVPIGTRVIDKDGLVTTESMGEYVARGFIKTEKRMDAIEATLAEIKVSLQTLQGDIGELKQVEETLPKEIELLKEKKAE